MKALPDENKEKLAALRITSYKQYETLLIPSFIRIERYVGIKLDF